ncbi:SapC family protein, partial [Oceanospirillum sp. HFRX-1_2]
RNPTGTIEIIALFTCNGEHLIKKGQWSLKQQPDLLQLYPFTWMLKQRDIKLAYYPQAPHFQGKGQKLLTSKGKPTRKLNDVIKGLDKAQSFFSVTGQRMMELVRFNLLTPITVAQNVTLPQETYLVLKEPLSEETRSQLSGEVAYLLDCHVKSLALLPAINGALMPSAEAAPKAAEKKAPAKQSETKKAADKKASEKKAPAKKAEPSKKADTAKKAKIAKNTEPKAAAANSATGIDSIIDAACANFGVSRDDLQSRKRNDLLTQARNQLAAEAKAVESLKEMAAWLERSPAT